MDKTGSFGWASGAALPLGTLDERYIDDPGDSHGLTADSDGILRRDYRTVDGSRAADITFENVHVREDALLGTAGTNAVHQAANAVWRNDTHQ